MIKKKVITKSEMEPWELVPPISVSEKSDGGFRLILNLKKLNEKAEYKKIKMKTTA